MAGPASIPFAGNRAAYVIEALSGGAEGYRYRITSAGAVDLARGIERIDFADSRNNTPSTLINAVREDADLAVAPKLSVDAATRNDDGSVDLRIAVGGVDAAGDPKTIGLHVEGVPEGARLSAGTYDAGSDSWLLASRDLEGLRLIPAADFAGAVDLTVRAIGADAPATPRKPPHD